METPLTEGTRRLLLSYQQAEVTDHIIYSRMARGEKDPQNRAVLERIAAEEVDHAAIWQKYTGRSMQPNRLHIFWYSLLGWLMGYTFVIRLMEKGEYTTGKNYSRLLEEIPEAAGIIEDEQRHEEQLAEMLDEERLQYVGAMVLGLNDALVELTGVLAGLTFALANTQLVALSGIITGASATCRWLIELPCREGRGEPAGFQIKPLYGGRLSGNGGADGAALPSLSQRSLCGCACDHAAGGHPDHLLFQLLHQRGPGSALCQTLRRDGWDQPRRGAHLLRHRPGRESAARHRYLAFRQSAEQ